MQFKLYLLHNLNYPYTLNVDLCSVIVLARRRISDTTIDLRLALRTGVPFRKRVIRLQWTLLQGLLISAQRLVLDYIIQFQLEACGWSSQHLIESTSYKILISRRSHLFARWQVVITNFATNGSSLIDIINQIKTHFRLFKLFELRLCLHFTHDNAANSNLIHSKFPALFSCYS